MPKKTFAMDRGGPARVEIEWRGIWKDVRVRVDGNELGVFANKGELEAGREFPLPVEGILAVQLARGFAAVELRVTRDGMPLPGSATDPAERVKQAAYMMYFIAALNVVLGGLVELVAVDFLRSIGVGWASVVEGAIYAVLGWQTSKRSRVALSLGIGLFALDTVWLVVNSVQSSHGPSFGGLFARVIFLMPLVNGLRGLRELKSGERTASRSPVGGAPNFRDLDGWDALLFVVGMIVGSAVLVAIHSDVSPGQIGSGAIVGGIVPVGVRRTFWPHTVRNASRHSLVTLLLVGVGGFVMLLGLIVGALFTMFLRQAHDTDPTTPAIVLLPIGVLFVGGLLIFTGMRLARASKTTAVTLIDVR